MKDDPVNIHHADIPGWFVSFNRENGESHSEHFTEKKHALIYAKQKRMEIEQRKMRADLAKARLQTDDTPPPKKPPQKRKIISGFGDSANLEKFNESGIWEAQEFPLAGKQWEEITNTENGFRYVHGKGGGALLFVPDGSVEVFWNHTAALAGHVHEKKNRPVKSGGKDMPPELDELFSHVSTIRKSGLRGANYPARSKEPEAIIRLQSYPTLTWRMLRAVALGNYQELEDITQHLKRFEALQKEEIGISHWQDIADAIQEAATNGGCAPLRREVYAAYTDRKKRNPEKNSLNDALVRMGFGWLPAPPVRGDGKQKRVS